MSSNVPSFNLLNEHTNDMTYPSSKFARYENGSTSMHDLYKKEMIIYIIAKGF